MTTLIPKFEQTNSTINLPISSKLQQYISVIDFGADPTGTSDSTTAIQNAINQAATTTGTVIFPAGTFLISSSLSLGSLSSTSGTVQTYIKIDQSFDANTYTTLEIYNNSPSSGNTFTLYEVYLADQSFMATGTGNLSNLYKC